jgi:hypothetical protein
MRPSGDVVLHAAANGTLLTGIPVMINTEMVWGIVVGSKSGNTSVSLPESIAQHEGSSSLLCRDLSIQLNGAVGSELLR